MSDHGILAVTFAGNRKAGSRDMPWHDPKQQNA